MAREGKWRELEQLFNENRINVSDDISWPPLDGAINQYDEIIAVLNKYDRFQRNIELPANAKPGDIFDAEKLVRGYYFSPVGSSPVSFGQRALKGVITDYHLEYEIVIKGPIDKTAKTGKIIPWHGHEGGALQTKFSNAEWFELIRDKKVQLNLKSSPSGMFEILPGGKVKLLRLP